VNLLDAQNNVACITGLDHGAAYVSRIIEGLDSIANLQSQHIADMVRLGRIEFDRAGNQAFDAMNPTQRHWRDYQSPIQLSQDSLRFLMREVILWPKSSDKSAEALYGRFDRRSSNPAPMCAKGVRRHGSGYD
jgi:hypothetical protein